MHIMSLIHKHLVCGFGFQINIFLQVQFLGEEGQDGGGPSREFWGFTLSKDIKLQVIEVIEDARYANFIIPEKKSCSRLC